jgi:hypothetical protein
MGMPRAILPTPSCEKNGPFAGCGCDCETQKNGSKRQFLPFMSLQYGNFRLAPIYLLGGNKLMQF